MGAIGVERSQPAREPFPWFLLVLFALLALGTVATSAVRIYRFHIEDTAREQRWHAEHETLMREVADREGAEQAHVP